MNQLATSNAPHRRRVLLIEDEQEQSQLLKRWIEVDLGFEVSVAQDGHEAEGLVERPEYDLIVTDIGLPGKSGLQVLERSKALYPTRPALVVTAFDGREVLLEALRKKADDFISKPLSRDYAVKRLARLAEKCISPLQSARKTVLAISAHPDDAEIGCGGALLKHRETGDRVVLAVMTCGARGGNDVARKTEAQNAAKRLGAELELADLQDGALTDGPETIVPLERIIQSVHPDVVYTHSRNDTHQDHRAVARATRVAARGVNSLYCYQSPSTTVEFSPTKFISIGTVLEDKLELLKLFESQQGKRPYLTAKAIRASAHYWARYCAYEPAEPLEVVREHR